MELEVLYPQKNRISEHLVLYECSQFTQALRKLWVTNLSPTHTSLKHISNSLQQTQPLAQLQPEPEKKEPETEHAQDQQESDPEPEQSSEREPLAVLPENIENPVLGFCTNNACMYI